MSDKDGNVVTGTQVIDIAGNARVVHGFLYGMRHPAISLSVRVRCHGDEAAALARIDRELQEIFPLPGRGIRR